MQNYDQALAEYARQLAKFCSDAETYSKHFLQTSGRLIEQIGNADTARYAGNIALDELVEHSHGVRQYAEEHLFSTNRKCWEAYHLAFCGLYISDRPRYSKSPKAATAFTSELNKLFGTNCKPDIAVTCLQKLDFPGKAELIAQLKLDNWLSILDYPNVLQGLCGKLEDSQCAILLWQMLTRKLSLDQARQIVLNVGLAITDAIQSELELICNVHSKTEAKASKKAKAAPIAKSESKAQLGFQVPDEEEPDDGDAEYVAERVVQKLNELGKASREKHAKGYFKDLINKPEDTKAMQDCEAKSKPLIDGEGEALSNWTGARIHALRKQIGLTQADFSNLLGISRRWLSKLETGIVLASLELCELLDEIENRQNEN